MAFQLKDFASVTASMINWMQSVQTVITDFNIGAACRTMFEAAAAEIDELYKQIFIGLTEAIPVSVYTSFNFPALAAFPAGGFITVTITAQANPVDVAAGTLWTPSSGSINYSQTADVTIPAETTTINVPVSAVTAGSAGNQPASTTFNPNPVPTGFVSATNAVAWINGTDTETPAQQKVRFNAYISTISRGTLAAIKYGLSTVTLTDNGGNVIERVATSQVVEPWVTDDTQPVSLVKAWIYNGVGGTSDDLVAQAQNVVNGYYLPDGTPVPGWKAAGVQCIVSAVTETAINVSGAITAAPGYDTDDLDELAEPVIFAYIQGLATGASFIYVDMTTAVKNIPGVANFIPTNPTADIAGVVGTQYIPGTISLD